MKLYNGQVVDRYTVDALLGAGGTAMVYRVRHNQLGTLHALKVLSLSSVAIRQRMLREGQVQATLQHLNVVAVSDVLDLDGAPGLLMEYIEGPSLERALGEFRLTMGDAEVLFHGIVAGVRQAHSYGLVHRDLKPANVLLARTQAGFVPKVTDFGLAKVLQHDPSVAHTRSGIAMGTPSYMAPEQIRDARTVDQRADVWSLGCLLYELVTRHRAFPGDEALPIYNAVTGGEYVPPRQILPDLPDRVDQAIRGCMTVDRERRIPDCEALLDILAGRRAWDLGTFTRGRGADDTSDITPVSAREVALPSDVPDMPVAAREDDGSTPAPPPIRSDRVPLPSASHVDVAGDGAGGLAMVPLTAPGQRTQDPETVVLRSSPMDGTLDASDSMHPLEEEEEAADRSWVGLVLLASGVFVVGSAALLVSLTLLGSLLFVDQLGAPRAPGTPAASFEADPIDDDAPGEDTPLSRPPPNADAAVEAPPRVEVPAPVKPAPGKPAAEKKPQPAAAAPAPRPPAPAPAPPEPEAAAALAQVKVLSVPPTATLHIDGEPVGRTPAKVELSPGRHVVGVQSGDRFGEFPIEVLPSGENKWCFAFGPTGPAGAGTPHEGGCP